MEKFSFNLPISLSEESKWILGVTSFECSVSVFNITNESYSFSTTIPGHWKSEYAEKTINELNKLRELRSDNDIELHVIEVRKLADKVKKEKIIYPTLILVKHIKNL